MRRAAVAVYLVLLACAKEERPLSEPGEKLYPIRGVILARNAADNSVRLEHEDIPGFMQGMIMDFRVRGAEVARLPADKSKIEAKLHVTSRSYWITDVKQVP
jgi:Copper binding periplasmic protein CusF